MENAPHPPKKKFPVTLSSYGDKHAVSFQSEHQQQSYGPEGILKPQLSVTLTFDSRSQFLYTRYLLDMT